MSCYAGWRMSNSAMSGQNALIRSDERPCVGPSQESFIKVVVVN